MKDGVVFDEYNNKPVEDVVKELNGLEDIRINCKKRIVKKNNAMSMMRDTIDGFVALEQLRYDGMI